MAFKKVWTAEAPPAEWRETLINLVDYAGKEIYIAFRYEGKSAHQWYVDDLTIAKLTGKDAGVTAIVSPATGSNLTASEPVKIKVNNVGAEDLTNVAVEAETEDGQTVSGTIPSIEVNEEVEYTFLQTLDLSEIKNYTITARVVLPDDVDPLNNTCTQSVINYGNVAVMGNISSVSSCSMQFADDGGLQGNYDSRGGIQTITFYPADPGSRLRVQFTGFVSYPEIQSLTTNIPGDTLFVYEGNVPEPNKLLGILTGDLTGKLPEAFSSTTEEGSLTFVFIKRNGGMQADYNNTGWEADVLCYTPSLQDVGVIEILAPLQAGLVDAQVKARIKNYGTEILSFIPVAYQLNGHPEVVENYTGNLEPGAIAEFTFTQPVDLSVADDYTLRVYTGLPEDGDETNNEQVVSFFYREPVTLYGYRTYDLDETLNRTFVSFSSNKPSEVKMESNYKDENNAIHAGEYVNNRIYAYTAYSDASRTVPRNYIQLSGDWVEKSVQPTSEHPIDMTYDYSTGTMYAAVNSPEGALVKTVDLGTGMLTTVITLSDLYLYTLAADLSGKLYGVDSSGNFGWINQSTGTFTVIASTGIEVAYVQSMAFDHATGRLFWAMCNKRGENRLLELNPETGAILDYGSLGEDTEVTALYTPYMYVGTPEVHIRAVSGYVYAADGEVHITGYRAGASVRIYTVVGQLIYARQLVSGSLPVALQSGAYVVHVQSDGKIDTYKVLVK